jgi:hypothetical protein
MKTFIQIAEVWTPSRDRSTLEHHDGLYGEHRQFARASRDLCFGYDEGLPGKAWASRQPVLLKDLQSSWFKRSEAAAAAGLSCAVAIPLFAGDFLLAVLVFFCGDDDQHVGAIELWRHDPDISPGLKLSDGYFGISESFEWVAQHTEFMRGFGLPGMAWQSEMPEILDDLGHSTRFVRRDDARKLGITKGLALPFLDQPGHDHVLTFLSALGTPIARRFETWCPDETGSVLMFLSGACDVRPDFATTLSTATLDKNGSLLGQCWATGLPAMSQSIATENSPVGASAAAAGLDAMVAIPVIRQGQVRAIVALYF